MPCVKPLASPCDDIYLYDGSVFGFYCCVHECVYSKRMPRAIIQEDMYQPSLFTQISIKTDENKAERVRNSIPAKISLRALELIETVFLSCMEEKEVYMLRFLLKAYRDGPSALFALGHHDVSPLLKAERHLLHEGHLLTGFIRFSDYGGALAAVISPKNFILPFIARHFVSRFQNENFLIYDKTHGAALVYQDKKAEIIPMHDIIFPDAPESERNYRALWKQFYKTISIGPRYNPKCRMTHMPKRYWEHMTEMQ